MPPEISLDNLGEDDAELASPIPTPPFEPPAQAPPAPAQAEEEDESEIGPAPEPVKATVPEPTPPADLREGFQMLAQAADMPERTKAEKRAKDERLSFVRWHVARLQEGLPTLPMDATMFAHAFQAQLHSLSRERLEILAREHREVAELLAERDRLHAELEQLKAEFSKL